MRALRGAVGLPPVKGQVANDSPVRVDCVRGDLNAFLLAFVSAASCCWSTSRDRRAWRSITRHALTCHVVPTPASGELTAAAVAPRRQHVPVEERRVLEGEIVRRCLARSDKQCSIVEHRNYKARAPQAQRNCSTTPSHV